MIEELIQSPDKTFHITDNKQAKMLLCELGLIDKFPGKFPAVSNPIEVVIADCETHCILAFLFSGRKKRADNGYLVHCLPKTKVSLAKFARFVSGFIKNRGKIVMTKHLSENLCKN